MNKENLRPGQQQALDMILARIAEKVPRTAFVLPTRYGKSDVIRLAAIAAKVEGLACGSIALSPSEILRNQLVRKDKLDAMVKRYGLSKTAANMRPMLTATEHDPFGNGEHLLSATIQLATRNIDLFAELIAHMKHKTGLPVLIFIDECHETSEDKRRGELVRVLENAGALVLLGTATGMRADGEMIPGFKVNEISREDARRYVVTDAGDGIHNRVDMFEGERCVVELIADHVTTFQQAWNEKPSPLCNLSREVVEVQLEDVANGEEETYLSQCSPSKARKYISKAVWNEKVIRKAVELFLRNLELVQKVNEDAAGIIFTCSDSDGGKNTHAKKIKAIIEEMRPDEFACSIVTMKSEEGDETSTKLIEKFVGTEDKPGKGDVLLVKQMGGAGLDAPRLKVLLDLSPVRTVAAVIQRLMRVATPWEHMKTAHVITLADPLMDAIWKRHIQEEGGEAVTSSALVDMEFVKTYLKEKEDDPGEPLMAILSADIHGFDDNHKQVGNLAHLGFVNELLNRIPALVTLHTKADLSERLVDFPGFSEITCTSVAPERSVDQIIRGKQKYIVDRCKELAQSECPYDRSNPGPWVARVRHWHNTAKQKADVHVKFEIDEITNLKTLDVMENFLSQQ